MGLWIIKPSSWLLLEENSLWKKNFSEEKKKAAGRPFPKVEWWSSGHSTGNDFIFPEKMMDDMSNGGGSIYISRCSFLEENNDLLKEKFLGLFVKDLFLGLFIFIWIFIWTFYYFFFILYFFFLYFFLLFEYICFLQ